MNTIRLLGGPCVVLLLQVAVLAAETMSAAVPIELKRDDQKGQLQIFLDGKEALAYQYGQSVDFPHYYPVRSPSGKLLTVAYPGGDEPHHRSIWFADIVQLAGHKEVPFYFVGYAKDSARTEKGVPYSIRHVKFLAEDVADGKATVKASAVWAADFGKLPVRDEERQLRVIPLGNGEFLLDLRFTLRASYGDVTFVSDVTHYAWPYVRMHAQFSVEMGGGTITNSEGGVNEKETHDKAAYWVDYSNRIEGATEGLTVFTIPEDGKPYRWLTRDYGTFGPRRSEAKSGKPFTLKKGDSIEQHVGILVHSGDVTSGQVKERYQQFVEGKL